MYLMQRNKLSTKIDHTKSLGSHHVRVRVRMLYLIDQDEAARSVEEGAKVLGSGSG